MGEKSKGTKLQEALFLKKKHVDEVISPEDVNNADIFCDGYKEFLYQCKTEREVTEFIKNQAKEEGFTTFDEFGEQMSPGTKIYRVNRGKAIILAVIGKKSIKEGVHITAAHIDSPRIDLKQCPLYEDKDLAYFKTHYYGGIKKYQWTSIPLSLHGRIMKRAGEYVDVRIGEDDNDPKFVITDLLPHLATEQGQRKLHEGVKGEELNILIGSRPFKDDDASEKVKLNIMAILNEKYGIVEKDFLSAELSLVPAFSVDDIGFDRSMIGGYGQDDRVCSYPAVQAIFDCGIPEYTCLTVLADKEEVGSDGNTGLNSSYLRYFIEDLARLEGYEGRDVLKNSKCLSADVNAAFDPTFPSVFDGNNSAYVNKGVVLTKYTGARGKAGTSDASAEYVSFVRDILDENDIVWQTGELGKVDIGGGGTVAMFIANMDVDVIDMGVPVLSMHAPYEVVSKLDVYMAYKSFYHFFKAK